MYVEEIRHGLCISKMNDSKHTIDLDDIFLLVNFIHFKDQSMNKPKKQ